jgi:hypothetical protein
VGDCRPQRRVPEDQLFLDIFKESGYVAVVQSNYGGASMPVVQKICRDQTAACHEG